ncbi:biotin-dependent carboxyltransferase family protein [Lentzea sp. BCCO 10_0798]|uniref:Biotin-dependent carboxyltransferase family protein n=1 Tax=Lentzea kristufekii TaxID=3095430 RepID=A0ABU4TLG9_9PSEU|nr:biotin-dependent carboxyltransferase family protein [Lentzea sp. BCCO 10_0798]MDX8049082.1 biotin-dependent carboxyltransferase family protein [Lentzea sp. BCCO 10_0798]
MRRSVTIIRTGPQALVEDLGRPGNAHLGVPPSGALDQESLKLANRLVGNPEGAAGLELLLGGLTLKAGASCTVAVTGPATEVRVDGRLADSHHPIHLKQDEVLEIGIPQTGLRNYLALSGGIEVDEELGSRSTDLLSGIGPEPLRDNDVLHLGTPNLPEGADVVPPHNALQTLVIPIRLGPRDDWFDEAETQLRQGSWTVSDRSNRVGARLNGTKLNRRDGEIPSEGMITGAVQVPPDGQPVIFLNDHPTTGGYPVIGVVDNDYLGFLGQARPGTEVRFRPID